MKQPKVTVGVIVYKDTKYLEYSIPALIAQDYKELEIIIRDQSPNGEVYEYLKNSHPVFFESAHIYKGENLMHSGGHNAMIRKMKGDIYICASNDMLYPRDFVNKLVKEMQEHDAKVATCKLMQWDYQKQLAGDIQGAQTRIIDSMGIGLTKSHKFFDTGQGQHISDYRPQNIIGPSGALAVFHKDALKAIGYKNHDGKLEYFDETLHYKNDCDLAYRLTWAGFPCLVVDTEVFHDRQLGDKSGTGAVEKLKDHHQKAHWAKESSLFGHLVALEKNFSKDYSLGVKIRTRLSRMARFIYTLIFSPKMLHTYTKVSVIKGDILKKAKATPHNLSAKDIEALMI